MKAEAVAIAESRLRSSSRAYADLVEAKDDEEAFADIWFQFLTAWKSIWTSLEQGAKRNAASGVWFTQKKNERGDDKALSYMYAARNDEEHGLASTVKHSSQRGHKFVTTKDATALTFRFGRDGSAVLFDQDGEIVGDLVATQLPGMQLQSARVRTRGREVIVEPPHEHLGQPLDISPLSVAGAVLNYAEGMVEEARALIA